MKKLLAILAVIATSVVPAAAEPYVEADISQSAMAIWTRSLSRNSATFSFAAGARVAVENGVETLGMVGSGYCSARRTRRGTKLDCISSGVIKKLPMEGFSIDPELDSASLWMKALGSTHKIHWTGTGSGPQPSSDGGLTDIGASGELALVRDATATGTIFGTKLRSGRGTKVVAGMSEGGFAAASLTSMATTHLSGNRYRFELKLLLQD